MTRRKPSARALRREKAREQTELARNLERLARLEPGGSAARPLEVDSPAQVDVIAGAKPCPLCAGPLRLEEHAAVTRAGRRLRVARVSYTSCGSRRELWFALSGGAVH